MMDPDSFIVDYSSDDQSLIEFAFNAEMAAKLVDKNAKNRRAIATTIIETPAIASDDLIRDRYDAESKYSKTSATWQRTINSRTSAISIRFFC